MGTYNRTGAAYNGFFDIWTHKQIVRLADITSDAFLPNSQEVSVIGWVNSDDFEQLSETFGILPLAPSTKQTLGMDGFNQDFAVQEKT